MMNKKHPKANLENYSKLFVQLGLVLSLAITYFIIESKTYANEIAVVTDNFVMKAETEPDMIEYEIEQPKPKPQIPKRDLSIIKKIDNENNDEIESFIDIDKIDDPVEPIKFIEVVEPSDPIVEDVDFIAVEFAPVFPGCKGSDKAKLKECFSSKMSKFVNRKFNASLAEELGLSPGVKRIFTIFKIDNNGNVVDIQIKAPHKGLEKEASRVLKLLPKMTPGKQGSRNVGVKYAMPIAFKVE